MTKLSGPSKLTGAKQIAYCVCMQSNHWPHCDATHHSTGGSGPKIIELDKNKTYMLCRCFKSKNKNNNNKTNKSQRRNKKNNKLPLAYRSLRKEAQLRTLRDQQLQACHGRNR